MNNKLLIISLLFVLGCQKDGFDPNISKYVLMGGMSVGHPPHFEIYLSSLNDQTKLLPNEYEIYIENLKGEKEKAVNGEFINIIGEAGETYIISWKLIGDSMWRSFKKMMPPNRAEELLASNVKNNGDYRTIELNGNHKERYFLSTFSVAKIKNTSNKNTHGVWSFYRFNGTFFYPLDEILDAKLKIWPPIVFNQMIPFKHPDLIDYFPYTCNYLPTEPLFLYCISNDDFQNMVNAMINYYSFTDPFYSGKNFHYDYKDEKFLAISLFQTEITEFNFDEITEKKDACFAEISMEGNELDTNNYKISHISVRVRNENSSYFPYRDSELNQTKNIFLFDQNNLDYIYTLKNKNCTTLEKYDLVIVVSVKNIKNKYQGFQFPYTYQKGQGAQHIKLDIPKF